MNREKILALSRKSTKDEGIVDMKNKARRTNLGAHIAVEAFVWFFIFVTGIKNNLPLVFSLLITDGTAGAAYHIEKYRFTKKRKNIIAAVLCSIFAVINAICFVRFCFNNTEKLEGGN